MSNGQDQFKYVPLPDGNYGKFRADATDEEIYKQINDDFPGSYPPHDIKPLPEPLFPASVSGPTTIKAQPPWYKEWGKRTVEALPAIGATVGTAVASPTGPGALGGAVVGGMGGEALKINIENLMGWPEAPQTRIESAKDIGKSGLEQGIYEMLGGLIGKWFSPAIRAGSVAGMPVPAEDIFSMSRTPGYKMTASEIRGTSPGVAERISTLGMSSRKAIEKYKNETVEGAANKATEVLNQLAPKITQEASGETVQDALLTAAEAFKREGRILYQPFRGANGQQIPTSFDSLVALAQKMEAERTPMVYPPSGGPLQKLPLQSPAGSLLEYIKNLKSSPQNFDTAMQVREFLGNYFIKGKDRPIFLDKESQAMASRFWNELGDQLSKDAAAFDRAHPGATASRDWEAAKAFWREGRERFAERFYSGLLRKNPEFVAKTLQAGNVSDVKLMKNILFGYGTNTEKAQAKQAWANFQRSFAEQKFFTDPTEKTVTLQSLRKMKSRMEELGGPMLREIYSDPQGQEFLRNARAFAETASRMGFEGGLQAQKWEMVYDVVGTMEAMGLRGGASRTSAGDVATRIIGVQMIPRFMAAMFRSRTATQLFLETMPKWASMGPRNKSALTMRLVSEIVKGLQRSENEGEPAQ